MWSQVGWCFLVLACSVGTPAQCDSEERIVQISQGPVRGYLEPENNIFSFYGVPYATAPTGRYKFKAPLPAPTWMTPYEAVNNNIACPQLIIAPFMPNNLMLQEQCLLANIFVPNTSKINLSVLVYVHGGAFQMGYGNYLTTKRLQRDQKLIVVTFNYRLGAHGFLCLGTDDVPGNAGMKDQVALLRWVKDNIASFGGNPDDVTIAGYSAGSVSVDLLMLSPAAKGLFNKVIPESGANVGAISVQIDPVQNAKDYAKTLNFTNVDDIDALEEFYKTISLETLFTDGFMDRKDSTFVFTPCLERKTGKESFLEKSPYGILSSGDYEKVPMLYGFANMEGLFRVNFFKTWKNAMNEKFSDFLPRDLQFANDEEKERIADDIKKFYFDDKLISEDDILAYIDFFSDILFAYPTLRAVKLHVKAGHDKIYLYEYSFADVHDPINSSLVPYTNNVRGASHCAQTGAISDGLGHTYKSENDLSKEFKEVKALIREIWNNFIATGCPVPPESSLPEWPAAGADGSPHMSIGSSLELRGALLERRVRFWDGIYERHYRAPEPPSPPVLSHSEL